MAGASTPRRSTAEGTRETLMEAATVLFARHGYDAVSTRMLTRHARANIASIKYHFGSKADLYRATLERLTYEIHLLASPIHVRLSTAIEEADGDRGALARAAVRFVHDWMHVVLRNPRSQERMPFVVRELASPSPYFHILYDGFFCELYDAVERLVATARGTKSGRTTTAMRAHAAVSLLHGFLTSETLLWRRLGWDRYTPARLRTTVQVATKAFVAAVGLDGAETGTATARMRPHRPL